MKATLLVGGWLLLFGPSAGGGGGGGGGTKAVDAAPPVDVADAVIVEGQQVDGK